MGVRGVSDGRSQAGWRPAIAVASGGRAVARLAEAKKGMLALDNYNDNVCLLRCIEVHRGGGGGVTLLIQKEFALRFLAN